LARGGLVDVALAAKVAASDSPGASILVFDDATGRVIDLDLRGTPAEIVARLTATADVPDGPVAEPPATASASRGRPRLGVVAREVTLLPRHWQWLAQQRGGASQALRRLVEEARRADDGRTATRARQERAYRFMSAMAGNLPGFEEATRALFALAQQRFETLTETWPSDIRDYAHWLAWTIAEEARDVDSA
jgi:hypothetical protein